MSEKLPEALSVEERRGYRRGVEDAARLFDELAESWKGNDSHFVFAMRREASRIRTILLYGKEEET